MKATKKAYEEYLNWNSPEQGSEEWIVAGRIHMGYMWKKKYGTLLRKHDPIGFEVGYNEWKSNQKQ